MLKQTKQGITAPADIRVGAVADYLVGVKLKLIADKWMIGPNTVISWVRRAKDFRLRMDYKS